MINYYALFEATPSSYLVLTPNLIIIAANESYLNVTKTNRENILGKGLFEIFPDSPNASNAEGIQSLKNSLDIVLRLRTSHNMPVQRYHIPSVEPEGSRVEERYWSLINSPVMGSDGNVEFIIHRVVDITDVVLNNQNNSKKSEFNNALKSHAYQIEAEIYNRNAQALHLLNKQLYTSELHVRNILENAPIGMATVSLKGNFISPNQALCQIVGYSKSELKTLTFQRITHPDDLDLDLANVQRLLDGAIQSYKMEKRYIRKNGNIVWIQLTASLVRDQYHKPMHFIAQIEDITERKQAAFELIREKERLRVTLSSIGDAVITTDTTGNITYLNPVAETLTGWKSEEAIGLPLTTVFHIVSEETGETIPSPVESILKNEIVENASKSVALIQRSGTRLPIDDSAAPIKGPNGEILGMVLVFHDVSYAREMTAAMTYQATHDALTDLINRREFERRLALALQSGHEHQDHTLLYLDLDQFKIVNDTCGHIAGDELLRQLTVLLRDKLRKNDLLARLGGDEFGILLQNCTTEPAKDIAELVRQTISDFNFVWLDKKFPIGVSIGLVSFTNGDSLLPDIMRMADAACYVAKDMGRNRIHVYSNEDQQLVRRHGEMSWIARIKKALDEHRFVLYSQQILALGEDGEGGNHYELLLRMFDEKGDIIPPMAFIPAAERYSLMPLLDRWVIQTAFAGHAERHQQGEPWGTCAINLSGKSICDENFLAFVSEQFLRYKVSPKSICFEITETAAIANLSQAIILIRALKAMGCRFALDDFGSGMSSFAYLKHLPVDYLKIDGGFVKDMVEDKIDRAMVKSINEIGQVMGIKTIAEFVENEAILAALREIGVNFAQGYGIEKPKPAGRNASSPLIKLSEDFLIKKS
ncbi:MAG: EAL domain-containing protein [Pseudomonadota bacterium]